jgi:hypothetical protein
MTKEGAHLKQAEEGGILGGNHIARPFVGAQKRLFSERLVIAAHRDLDTGGPAQYCIAVRFTVN